MQKQQSLLGCGGSPAYGPIRRDEDVRILLIVSFKSKDLVRRNPA